LTDLLGVQLKFGGVFGEPLRKAKCHTELSFQGEFKHIPHQVHRPGMSPVTVEGFGIFPFLA
jgi:hypothetical protein